MDSCLNILERPEVFLSAAALIVIVLLVWAQWQGRPDSPNINFEIGQGWTYLAIVLALIAVAVFVFERSSSWAKGLLILSFLMVVINMLISFGLSILKVAPLIRKPSINKSFTKFRRWDLENIGWTLGWAGTLVGLIFISFYIAGIWGYYFLGLGITLVVSAGVYLSAKKIKSLMNKSKE